jgi:hypothetical protein
MSAAPPNLRTGVAELMDVLVKENAPELEPTRDVESGARGRVGTAVDTEHRNPARRNGDPGQNRGGPS